MKDHLFQLIRKGETILWAGAGLSIYAGYPSGKQLKEILMSQLPVSDFQLDDRASLSDITEAITKHSYSRNHLIRTLIRLLDAKPGDVSIHSAITKIAHFKTIVTTNYDRLFETVYQNRLKVVIESSDVAYLNNSQTELFKIHGCISKPDSIVITKGDYNNFFKNYTDQTLHWSVLRERMITRPIVFVGYSLNDDNVRIVLERIIDDLGDHHRELFLVAPGWPLPDQIDLAKRGIVYVDLDAKTFFDELMINIKENVYSDYKNGLVPLDIFEQFISNFDLSLQLSNVDGVKRASIIPNKNSKIQVNFTTDLTTGEIIDDYIAQNNLSKLLIKGDKIKNYITSFNGIVVPEFVKELLVVPAPQSEFFGSLRLPDGLELEGVKFSVYANSEIISVNFNVHKISIDIKIKKQSIVYGETGSLDMTIDCTHDPTCGSVKQEIETFEFLSRVGSGEAFEFYKDDINIFSGGLTKIFPAVNTWKAYFDLFCMLRRIQKHFSISFGRIDFTALTAKVWDDAYFLGKIIDNQEIIQEWHGEIPCWIGNDEFVATKDTPVILDGPLYLFGSSVDKILILGKEIKLGYPAIAIHDPILSFDRIDDSQLWPNRHILRSNTAKRTIAFSEKVQASTATKSGDFSVLYIRNSS